MRGRQSIRLQQHAFPFERAQLRLEGRSFVGFARVNRGLRDDHTQFFGVERDPGGNSRRATRVIWLASKTPQGFATIDRLFDILFLISALG